MLDNEVCSACGPPCKRNHPSGPGFVMQRGYTLEEAKASVGKGWHVLLEVFFAAKAWNAWNERNDVRVVQVKEKFGTLRLYYDGGNDTVEGFVDALDALSARICEGCGAPGRCRGPEDGRRWLLTLCDTCHNGPYQRPYQLA